MILIIAEKPSLARNIVNAIGQMKRSDGYYYNDEYFVLSTLCLAIDIIDGASLAVAEAKPFGVQVGEVSNLILPVPPKQSVQETDKKLLVRLRPEKLLEGEIRVEIHVATCRCSRYAHSQSIFMISVQK